MRYIKYLILALVALAIVGLSVANRSPITVVAWPDLTAYGFPRAPIFSLPLFVVALAFGAIGFVLGAAREYLREARLRRRAVDAQREAAILRGEVQTLKRKQNIDEDDEIIALTSR